MAFVLVVGAVAPTVRAQGSSPAHADADVTVIVRCTENGQLLKDVYVALVASDRPWSRPSAEAVTADGSATLSVLLVRTEF